MYYVLCTYSTDDCSTALEICFLFYFKRVQRGKTVLLLLSADAICIFAFVRQQLIKTWQNITFAAYRVTICWMR